MSKIGELIVKIGADASSLKKELNSSTKQVESFGKKMESIGGRLKSIGQTMTLGVTMPIVGAAAASFKLASDMSESVNKVDVAFKDNSAQVKAWSQNTLAQFGLAKGTALDMAAGYGDMATSMGLTTEQAANMSTSLVGLGGDLASFKNKDIAEVNTALNGIFTGETESLKMLGIVMTQANLEEYAASQGIKKKIKDMTQAEQVQLRYNYVMAKTQNAQGDFARTQGGAANQMRIFTESLKELGASFGENLLPVITPFIQKINEIVKGFGALSPEAKKTITVMAGIAAVVGPILVVAGSLAGAFVNISKAFGTFSKISKGAGFLSKAGMLFNPWVLGIALVIGAIYLLWKNWDKIKGLLVNSWEWIKQKAASIWGGIKDFFARWWPALLIVFGGPIGAIAVLVIKNWDKIKTKTIEIWGAIKEFVLGIAHSIAKGVDALLDKYDRVKAKADAAMQGASIAYTGSGSTMTWKENGYASGTSFARKGWAWTGERGPELINFGGGETVLNNSRAMAALSGGTQQVVHTGTVIHEFKTMDGNLVKKVAEEFSRGNRRIPGRVATMPLMP